MNMMRRLLRLAPLLALPILRTNKVWMNTMPEEPVNTLQFEEIIEGHLHPVILESKQEEEQPQHQQQQPASPQPISQSEEPRASRPDAQIDNKQSAQQTKQVTPQTEKIENEQKTVSEIIQLKQNEALVHQSCPLHIISYLYKTNYKIYRTDDPTCKLRLKNQKGHTFTLNLEQIAADKKDEMSLIANFINPPIELTTIDQAKQIMKIQQKDSFLIFSYLPKQQDYDNLIKTRTKSMFDNFTTTRKANLSELQQTFTSLAYNSSSNKNTYLIVRSKEVADYLRINNFNIGIPYVLNKTTRNSGNQSNNQWQGMRYQMANLAKQWNHPINTEILNHLTHLYINRVDSEAEAYNKIRQMQMSKDNRKLLLVYTAENRQDFHNQLDDILEKVARTEKQNVIILKTQNQQVLKRLFKVEPDNFTTIRLFNLNQQQTPLFGLNSNINNDYYSRSKFKGAFRYENICHFINRQQWQQYYESKRKLSYIKTVGPQQLRKLDNTLVLLEKDGCQGCKYVEQSLDQLKKVTKAVTSNPKLKKKLIYRYKIEDPNSLTNLKIRRYSIFNESFDFTPPTTTPKLFMFSQGKLLDLHVDQSLAKMKQIKSDAEAELIHDSVLSDIINRIRLSQNQTFSEF